MIPFTSFPEDAFLSGVVATSSHLRKPESVPVLWGDIVVGDVQPGTTVFPGTAGSQEVAALSTGQLEAVSVGHGQLVPGYMEEPAHVSLVTIHGGHEKSAYP